AHLPDLGRSTLTLSGITDPDAHGVITAGAEGTGTTGAYPLVATGVALLLLLEALLELLDQLVEPTQGLDLGLFLVGEQAQIGRASCREGVEDSGGCWDGR